MLPGESLDFLFFDYPLFPPKSLRFPGDLDGNPLNFIAVSPPPSTLVMILSSVNSYSGLSSSFAAGTILLLNELFLR